MALSFFEKAKAFIGFDDETEVSSGQNRQLDMTSFLKRSERKELKPSVEIEAEYEILICEPKVYEDSLTISQHLRSGNPVIINLKNLEQNEGTRLVDFVCGTAYAIDGHMVKIGDAIFLFTPPKVAVKDVDEKASISSEIGLFSAEKAGRS